MGCSTLQIRILQWLSPSIASNNTTSRHSSILFSFSPIAVCNALGSLKVYRRGSGVYWNLLFDGDGGDRRWANDSPTVHSPFLMKCVSAMGTIKSNFKREHWLHASYIILTFISLLMIFRRECNEVLVPTLVHMNIINESYSNRTQISQRPPFQAQQQRDIVSYCTSRTNYNCICWIN